MPCIWSRISGLCLMSSTLSGRASKSRFSPFPWESFTTISALGSNSRIALQHATISSVWSLLFSAWSTASRERVAIPLTPSWSELT